jgi:prolyl-tRNA editing enzyme YbaK/EbsC (Cys-tRNA(Pro) deacylase)
MQLLDSWLVIACAGECLVYQRVGDMMNEDDLARFIAANAIAAELVYLSVETPTVEAAAEALNVHPDQIGKSILFLVQGKPILVIANGQTKIGYKKLADYLDTSRRRIKLANPNQVQAITGFPVGTVPPFGHPTTLRRVMDSRVLAQDEVYVGGGAINALVRIETKELLRVTAAETVNLVE